VACAWQVGFGKREVFKRKKKHQAQLLTNGAASNASNNTQSAFSSARVKRRPELTPARCYALISARQMHHPRRIWWGKCRL